MKRHDLEQILSQSGYWFLRNGKHCLYTNGVNIVAVPMHKDINKFLAKKIIKSIQFQERKAA